MKRSNPHNFVVLLADVLMHSLPGIVDGARKTSQVGRWVRAGARGGSRRYSSLPMLEATTSRDKCITCSATCITYVVHHSVRGRIAVGQGAFMAFTIGSVLTETQNDTMC